MQVATPYGGAPARRFIIEGAEVFLRPAAVTTHVARRAANGLEPAGFIGFRTGGRLEAAWGMYFLKVHYGGSRIPRATHSVARASDALSLISSLLEEHGECEKIAVYADTTFLFAVDCKGNRLPDEV